jgi:hypothetical protein
LDVVAVIDIRLCVNNFLDGKHCDLIQLWEFHVSATVFFSFEAMRQVTEAIRRKHLAPASVDIATTSNGCPSFVTEDVAASTQNQAFYATIRLKSAKGTTALHPTGEAWAPNRAGPESAPSKIQRQQIV